MPKFQGLVPPSALNFYAPLDVFSAVHPFFGIPVMKSHLLINE